MTEGRFMTVSCTTKKTTVILHSAQLSLTIHLPDRENGIYRGARFDWSSNISNLEYQGHSWFSPWKLGDTDPTANDQTVIGIGGEFGRGDSGMTGPLAYESTKPGDTFLKIGVGEVLRPDKKDYCFYTNYPVTKPAEWDIEQSEESITMTQQASLRDYGYIYQRKITLNDKLPGFTVEQKLENIGEQRICQYYYDHNFTNVDGMPPSPAWRLEFPFAPVAVLPLGNKTVIDGNILKITRTIPRGALFTPITGFEQTIANNSFTLWNDIIGQGLSVNIDKPLVKFALFASGCAVCPEPFIDINIALGESITWNTNYVIVGS